MMRPLLHKFRQWCARHRVGLIRTGIGAFALLMLVQLFYPGNVMPLFASVDGVNVSGWSKQDTIKRLDELTSNQPLVVSLTSSNQVADRPLPSDIGLNVSNKDRIESSQYPWYLRIVPTSLFWFGQAQAEAAPSYSLDKAKSSRYLKKVVGENCLIPAIDATLRLEDTQLQVVEAKAGGRCDFDEAIKTLEAARPTAAQSTTIKLPVNAVAPNIGDDEAASLATSLNDASKQGVGLVVDGKRQTIGQPEILSWLTFKSEDGGLTFTADSKKSQAYLKKNVTKKVSRQAGVTKVATRDFTETSRKEGASGRSLDAAKTLQQVNDVLEQKREVAEAVVVTVKPKVEYSRSYTKTSTGISAQLKYFDEDNPGVFGVSFQELGGRGLSAGHNESRQFVTASTYKLFVAYGTLKRVDSGKVKWSDKDIVGGRNLSTCFDDMIVKSDNECAVALLTKIGRKALDADIKSLGLGSSTFQAENNLTTAADLSSFLSQLEKGSMKLKSDSRVRLLSAMKRNVYRQGIPNGASGQTADKVGFLWALLHDASIVYSPKGTYVLVVLSDGSSWGKIAELTRKIEALR